MLSLSFLYLFQFNNNNNKKNLYIEYTMNRQLSKAQRSLEKMMGKKNARMASNVVAVILVLVAVLLVPHLPLGSLQWLDHIASRVVLMVVIVLVCLVDPVVALLLAILFVVCLQRLHKLKKERNAQVVLSAINTVVKNNKIDELKNVLNKANNSLEEELVEDELPSVEDQTNVLPVNNMDNSEVVLSEVNPANMRQEVEYNLQPDNLDNVVQLNIADNAVNNSGNVNANGGNANAENAGNPNQVGALLEEGSDNVLSANNTEHFLSVENASGNQNNVLTARIVCRKSGFENDVELVQEAKRNNEQAAPVNNRPTCKPFTTEFQFKDVQSNLVNCKENNNNLSTQGHGNMKNVPQGTMV